MNYPRLHRPTCRLQLSLVNGTSKQRNCFMASCRYDLDGIHFDDYFYPYPVDGVDFPDDVTWLEYKASGGKMLRADWRRHNVNNMVKRAYDLTRRHRVKFR